MTTNDKSTGARALIRWIEQTRGGAALLAAALGVSRSAVYAWAAGYCVPDTQRWRSIENVTGIPALAWLKNVPE